MNTMTLALELGEHYQTVSRAYRAVLKAEGNYQKKVGHGNIEYTPEIEAKVRLEVERIRRIRRTKKKIRSTMAQRKLWLQTWTEAFLECEDQTKWVNIAVVIASIDHSKNPGWLSQKRKDLEIGEMVYMHALKAGVDTSGSGFTEWLKASGFARDWLMILAATM